METLFLGFFNRAMAAGWLVLAVLVLRLVFKKAPKWVFCLLWLLVGVRLAVPLEIESVLSLLPSAEVISPSTLYSAEPTITTGVQAINRVVNPVVSSALAPNPGDSVNPLQVITILAGWVWVIGVAVMLLYCLVSFLRLRHRVAEAVPEEGVWLCETIASPFILGLFRPRIYLPAGLNEPERSYVLAHERAHLSRRDHWIKPLAFVLLALYWFHPLVWVAYILLCRDIELACDEKVIRILGEGEKKPYSSALLTCSVSRRSIAACPLAFGEVGVKQRIVSILNYKKPAFWVVLVALIAGVIAAVCFLTDPVTELPTPLGQRYRVQEVLYHAPISSTEYRAERMPVYEIAADGTMVSHLLMVDSEVVGKLEEIKLNKDWFDRYCSTREDAEFTQADAKALRRGNYKAWRYADFKDPAQQMYVLLQQKNGDLLLFVGWLDSEAQTDSASDDSFFTHAMRLEPTDTLPERTEEIPAFIAGALVGQHMGLSFLPKDGVDLGLFYLHEDVLTWTDTDGKAGLDFVWKETQRLSQEEFETKMKEAGIMFAADLPEGDLTFYRYFSQAENTGIELYYFWGATWINLNNRIFELVPEGTIIIPVEWPTGEDEPAQDETEQEQPGEDMPVEPLDPLVAATWGAIRLHNQPYPGAANINFNFELLDEVTAIGCGEDENGAFSVTTVTRLIAAMYWEFDFDDQGLMQPVKEIYAPAVVELQLREDGQYDIVSYWQGEPNAWDTELIAEHYPLGVTDNVPDFSEETRTAIWRLFTQVTYQGLIEIYGIDAQWEIGYLFGSIMDGYHRLGNNSEFREEYLDEYNRILCYGDEALRFVLHEFMYGGQVDYRGVLLKEFLLRLMPETSIDLYTETAQEYFDSWCRFMFREYDRLGEEKTFELYPRMPVFLEVMAEYNTPDESIDESVLEGVYNTPDDSIAE